MVYFVYILFSETLGQYYTGSTSDFNQRFSDHNNGLSKHIRKWRSWNVIFVRELNDKTSGLQLENKIKRRGARRYLQDENLL